MIPYVQVNCAITLDGCMGGPGRTTLEISNPEDKRRVHELRAGSDAILVGVGTVLSDDPHLTVKWELLGRAGTNPLRVVLDPALRTPAAARVLNGAAPTLLFGFGHARPRDDVAVERVAADAEGRLDLGQVLQRLSGRGVRRLMVEGGARTLQRFFVENRVDEATVFISPRSLGALDAPRLLEAPFDLRANLRLERATPLGDGLLVRWVRAR